MRAFVLQGHGGPEKLVYEKAWPRPEVRAGEVLIEVRACGVNNTDVNTRLGWYGSGGWSKPLDFPRIQGADICGRVVDGEAAGRRVLVDPWLRDRDEPTALDKCGYLGSERDGGFAEFVSVPAENVHAIESTLSDVELASFATASVTAANMLDRARVTEGEDVLITGASGGVGSALVQLARGRGARPIAVCSASKAEAVRALGAVTALPRDDETALEGVTVDVVLDVVGGPGWQRLMRLLRRGGRYCCSGAIAGPIVELDLRTLYLNDLTFTGATVTPPHLFGELVRTIERGELEPVVAATFPLEELHAAQEMFLAKEHVGNIVIAVQTA